MSGLVGIIANDFARCSIFGASVTKMERPAGTRIEWLIGGDWCSARNTLVEMMLKSKAEWLWYIDDDHSFAPDLLMKLLRHERRDIVMPLVLQRVEPFLPVACTARGPEGEFWPINLAAFRGDELVELEGGGTAGMLIRRRVLETVKAPWFEHTTRSEDLVFCEKAKAAGFSIHCDLSARLGHVATAEIWPSVREGAWYTGLRIGHYDVNVPIYQEEPA